MNCNIEKDELQVNKMPSAKYLWRLHIGMLKPTLSIRAFGDPLVRARKAGVCRIKTPTLCREGNKIRVGNGEKIILTTTIILICQILLVSSLHLPQHHNQILYICYIY